MRALVCDGPGSAVLRDVAVPAPGPGEVLVRVAVALTCGTDLKIVRRGHPKIPFPLTLGHEWAGVVEKAGRGAAFSPGTRVTSAVSSPCGACEACRAGRENLCASAFDRPLFGAFADFLLVPERLVKNGLRRIPDGMPDETAALLDPLASAVRGLNRVGDARGKDVLIVGTGPIAALLFFLLRGKEGEETGRAAERRVVIAGRRAERLAFFERNLAEVAHIGPSSRAGEAGAPPPVFTFKEVFSSLSPSSSFSLVIDTTGDPGVIEALPALASDGGTVLLFAGLPAEARVAIDAHAVHYREVSIVGSFHYTPREVDEALGLLSGGAIPAAEIVSARRPLAEWEAAFDVARAGAALKVGVFP
ncbi:MAG TPA: alcohol dehydrogenase catalytic domain-containing protein [Thermoanaerobaculia bacterium]|nr:alcohol dehydrogenase catalytic domain-containing protein [Thermoanaerobaculia bacterium]